MIASAADADLVSDMAELVAAQYSVAADSIFGTIDKRRSITDARRAFHWCCVRMLDLDAYHLAVILSCNTKTVRDSVEHIESLVKVGLWDPPPSTRALSRVERWR